MVDPHGPVEERYRAQLVALARVVDEYLNGDKDPKEVGFVLLMFDFGHPDRARMNYISNAVREDMLVALKELVARFEGRAHDAPSTQQ